jgi:glycosidase
MNFDFPLAGAILDAVRSGDPAPIDSTLAAIQSLYPPGVTDAPFLTNHDMVREATQLGGDVPQMRLAAAILLTLPGSPFLYYGGEIGLMNGTTNNDEAKRTPMPWEAGPGGGFTTGAPWFPFSPGKELTNVAAETGDPSSLLSLYRQLIHLRKRVPALRDGLLELLSGGSPPVPVLAFRRVDAEERVLVLHNLGTGEVVAGPFDLSSDLVSGERPERFSLDPLFTSGAVGTPSADHTGWTCTLGPRSSGIWRLRGRE